MLFIRDLFTCIKKQDIKIMDYFDKEELFFCILRVTGYGSRVVNA